MGIICEIVEVFMKEIYMVGYSFLMFCEEEIIFK